eukprot:CAMPEP_0118946844 /NCGR_PEP_ID=MMETSP1169-20130426/44937_1 /TAXON_ID=36882 /ORGANISM="Pyramimonas obovata, Strain CCMP722" /LENGTH=136 /DNA_ID=CAMNT_0006892925 /DNA_START=594 /DNA_END=1001 /DNA_ORIENTATION=+
MDVPDDLQAASTESPYTLTFKYYSSEWDHSPSTLLGEETHPYFVGGAEDLTWRNNSDGEGEVSDSNAEADTPPAGKWLDLSPSAKLPLLTFPPSGSSLPAGCKCAVIVLDARLSKKLAEGDEELMNMPEDGRLEVR